MQKQQLDPITLSVALLASLAALTLLAGPYSAFAGLAGVALLLLLFSFDSEGYRSAWQSLAFAAVCGFCATDVAAYLSRFFSASEGPVSNDHFAHQGLAVFLGSATLICWAIDRARMSARQPASSSFSFRESAPASRFAPPAMSPPPPPVRPEPAPAPAPGFNAPPPVPAVDPSGPPQPTVPVSHGKETSIYVTLVGEGLNVLRSVRAEHLGRDYYKIVDVMPEGETWEYQPGQVVRARKKNLSSGKALVAVEEAPRAS